MAVPYIADTKNEETASRLPDWRELLTIIAERAWIGLFVAALIFTGFLIHLQRSVPVYSSTAVLMVEMQSPQIMNYQDVIAFNARNLEYFNTIVNTLYSRQMIEKAIAGSTLERHPAFFPGATGTVQKAALAKRLISIAPVEKSRLIHVTAEHSDPKIAAELANAVSRAYIQQDLDNRMEASMQAVHWLRERSVEYRDKLERGLLALQKYREEAGSVSLEEDQNIVIAKLKALNASLADAQTERIAAETRWQSVQSQADAGLPREQLAVQLEESGVQTALTEWRRQQQNVVQLEQRYKPGYPDLQEAVKLEASLRRAFEDACDLAVFSLKSRYETLKNREEALRAALQAQEKEAFALSRQLVRYNDLKRNVEADQEIYQSVISRMKEASMSGSLPTGGIRLAEEARPAARPFKPQPFQLLTRGLLIGLAAGLGVIFLLYANDHRFRRNEEVERALGVPVLTTLPFIAGKTVRERGLVCHLDSDGQVAEAFRTLRAIIQINPLLHHAKMLLVSSTLPGEGKSVVSTNLAISLAQDNRRTLLIGGDLRRPVFKQLFELGEMPAGLTDVLNGTLPWKEAVRSDLIPGLDILPAGSTSSQPAELLGRAMLAELLAELRQAYEYIIIDASPMMAVSDVLLLMKHTDGVLFVVRQGVTHSQTAIRAIKNVRESGVPCLGAVMNGVSLRGLGSYYYRYYGGYGYAYKQASPDKEAAG